MAYDEKLCKEMHDRINEKIEVHEKRLNGHSERLDRVEQNQSAFQSDIKNLCENLKSLTNLMRWFIGAWFTSLIGFFFFMIQNKLK